MKKKILLFGDPSSQHLTQFINNILEPLGFDIYMQISKGDLSKANSFIVNHGIKLIKLYEKDDFFLFRLGFVGRVLKAVFNYVELYKNRPFDCIHVHYVHINALFKANFVKSKYTKCYATFWGSDIFRCTESYLRKEEKYLKCFDLISADGYSLKKAYEKFFPYLKVNFKNIPFGISLFSYIDKFISDTVSCKIFCGFPLNKKVVCIGYNAIREQQHDKVLVELTKIENKADYFLVFHMSYGSSDDDYLLNLQKEIEKSGFEYKIIREFLSMDELAKLRIATDFFVNAQTTDAFANSFIEHLYAKTMIINASWLHYPEIDIYSLYVNEFTSFEEIPALLSSSISDDKLLRNRKCVENRTWDYCRGIWKNIYEGKAF